MRTWGTTAADEALPWPCDALLPGATHAFFRGVAVAASPARTFRWLCQMRVAPYSYDLIDNLGRRSPQELTPGLERLEVGQRIASIFRVAAFVPEEHITMATSACVMTYRVVPVGEAACRIVVKLVFRAPGPALARTVLGTALGWGDLVMMRRQLLNLAALAGCQP